MNLIMRLKTLGNKPLGKFEPDALMFRRLNIETQTWWAEKAIQYLTERDYRKDEWFTLPHTLKKKLLYIIGYKIYQECEGNEHTYYQEAT